MKTIIILATILTFALINNACAWDKDTITAFQQSFSNDDKEVKWPLAIAGVCIITGTIIIIKKRR